MKILHVFDHSIPLHSGYTFRSQAILQNQKVLGWKTAHVTSAKHIAKSSEEDVEDLHFYRTQSPSAFLNKIPLLNQVCIITSLRNRLDGIIEIEQPDILHAHSPALNGLATIHAGRKHRLPVVYECRAFWEDAAVDHGTSKENGIRYRLTRAMETKVFRSSNAVTTICEGLKNDIAARGIDAGKITVIPNAVDIDQFSFDSQGDPQLTGKLGLTGNVVLGFIGSFYAYEGLLLLLEALPDILQHEPNLRLLLVGGGPQEALLKERVGQLGLDAKVIMTGRVPHSKVQDYYNLVDIFIYPRLSMRLTELVTPLKPLEAMAQGKLVIASDVGGHKEMIEEGYNGRLFRANSSEALSEAVKRILGERDEWRRLKDNGRRYVERQRNWPISVAGYQAVYDYLLSAKG